MRHRGDEVSPPQMAESPGGVLSRGMSRRSPLWRHPSPESQALGTHRLHDPGDSWVFAKLLHKQVVLAGHLKGFGEEVTLGCLQLSRLTLQLLPEPLQVLRHVVFVGQLSSRMGGRAVSVCASLPNPHHPKWGIIPAASILWPRK